MQEKHPQEEAPALVEIASDEAVLRALAQSAHPVEFIESTPAEETAAAEPAEA
jgi:hypothetical protein